jgi:hypothetical protein
LWRTPEPKRSYDVVIADGGPGHGLATAHYLAKKHGITDVAVLEKSWLAGGDMDRNTTITRFSYLWDESAGSYEHALKLWEGLAEELDHPILFSQRGVLNLAHSPQDVRDSVRRIEANRLGGVDGEWLDADGVKEVCPIVNTSPEARYPVAHPFSRSGGTLRHDEALGFFVPDTRQAVEVVAARAASSTRPRGPGTGCSRRCPRPPGRGVRGRGTPPPAGGRAATADAPDARVRCRGTPRRGHPDWLLDAATECIRTTVAGTSRRPCGSSAEGLPQGFVDQVS